MSTGKKKEYQPQVNEDDQEEIDQVEQLTAPNQELSSPEMQTFEFEQTAATEAAEALSDSNPPYKSIKNQQDATAAQAANQKKKRATRLRATKIVQSAQDLQVARSSDGGSVSTEGCEKFASARKVLSSHRVSQVTDLKGNIPCLESFVHRKIFQQDQQEEGEKSQQLEQKQLGVQAHGKHEEIEIDESNTLVFLVKKKPKVKRGLLEYLTQTATRYLYIKDNRIYFLRKVKKHKYVVCSSRELSVLFKIYENRENLQELRMCFLNKERNPNEQPVMKSLEFYTASTLQHFIKVLSAKVKMEGYPSGIKTEN